MTQAATGHSTPLLTTDGAAVRFTRRRGSELSYRVEVSTDLVAWNFNGDNTSPVWTTEGPATPLGPESESVRVLAGPALAGASRAFFRIHVATR